MKDLMIVHLVYTLFGGVSVVAGNLIKEQNAQGIQTAVAYVEYDEALEKQVGFPIELYIVPKPKFLGQNMLFGMRIKKIYSFFKKKYPEKIIIIHAHNVQTVGLFSNIKNIPIVCTLHSMHGKDGFRSRISDLLYFGILKKLKNNEAQIVSVSKAIADFYDKGKKLGVRTIHNCVYPPINEKIINEHFTVGHIGDVSYAKGFDVMLKGFACAAEKNEDLRLVVAGKYKTISEENTKGLLNSYKITDKVDCLGFVINANQCVMPKIDLFVLASKNEGFGLTLIEAMAYGIPVLGTKVGGVPEIISDGYNGFFVENEEEIAQRILELSRDKKLYETFSCNAKRTFNKVFEINNMVREYVKIYKKLSDSTNR